MDIEFHLKIGAGYSSFLGVALIYVNIQGLRIGCQKIFESRASHTLFSRTPAAITLDFTKTWSFWICCETSLYLSSQHVLNPNQSLALLFAYICLKGRSLYEVILIKILILPNPRSANYSDILQPNSVKEHAIIFLQLNSRKQSVLIIQGHSRKQNSITRFHVRRDTNTCLIGCMEQREQVGCSDSEELSTGSYFENQQSEVLYLKDSGGLFLTSWHSSLLWTSI